jgi:hypothetical protein
MTAAVTPVPQLVMMGFDGSTPLREKRSLSSWAGSKVLSSGLRRSDTGTEMEWGMCPEERPISVR